MKIISILISLISARTIITRKEPESVTIYSIRGRHLTISSTGRIASTSKTYSTFANVNIIPQGKDQFTIQSEINGLYIAVSPNGRLRGVLEAMDATKFVEETIQENSFNTYKLAKNSNCVLIMRKNGKPRVSCNKPHNPAQISFLRRKTHQSRINRGSRF